MEGVGHFRYKQTLEREKKSGVHLLVLIKLQNNNNNDNNNNYYDNNNVTINTSLNFSFRALAGHLSLSKGQTETTVW